MIASEVERATRDGKGRDAFRFSGDFVSSEYTFSNESEVIAFHFWSSSRLPIYAVDNASSILVVDGTTSQTDVWARFGKGERYFLENVDRKYLLPGEWFQSGSRIEYQPTADERNALAKGTLEVRFPCSPNLLSVMAGAHDVIVRDLTFFETGSGPERLTHTPMQAGVGALATAAIDIVGGSEIHLKHLLVTKTENFAVHFGRAVQCPSLVDSSISGLGAGGILIGDPATAYVFRSVPQEPSCGAIISGTTIEDGGLIWPGAVAIWVGDVDRNIISGNEIHDFAYTAISVGWNLGGGRRSLDNRIENNRIWNIGRGTLSDLAGIYTLGDLTGSVIRGNSIKGVRSAQYGGFGIYLDRDTVGLLVEQNTIMDVAQAGVVLHYAGSNVIRDNSVCVKFPAVPILVLKPGKTQNNVAQPTCRP